MRDAMHWTYKLIPQRSFDAYVRRGTLDEVMCALIVDPDEAYDAAQEYGTRNTPHSLSAFSDLRGMNGVEMALRTVSEWTMQQEDAERTVWQIVDWDRRVGVWCVCQLARTALKYIPQEESRPRLAIEAAEKWLIGTADTADVRSAAAAASTYAADFAYSRVGLFPTDETDVITSAAYAAVDAATTAADYASARSPTYAASSLVYTARSHGYATSIDYLRSVIHDACLTFPR
jgi:hypothetical protein